MIKKLLFSAMLGVCLMTVYHPIQVTAQVTPEHIAKMKTVYGSVISPDGNYIAYTISNPANPKKENAYSQGHLYLMNVRTGLSTPFYTSASASQVHFRPGKGTITFLSRAEGDKVNALYEISLNGGEAQKIYTYDSYISSYEWNHKGDKIVFTSSEKENKPKTSLTYSPNFFEEEYSTKNAYIVTIGNNAQPEQLRLNGGSAYLMAWSPDDSKIAVSVAPTASVDDSYMAQHIKIINAAGKNIIADVNNHGKLGQIVWSPDGTQIAIVGAYDLNDPTDGCILTASANGGDTKVIDADFVGKYEAIDWKSKNKIYFLASEGVAKSIGTIEPDGSNKKYIYKSDNHDIGSFSLSNAGLISFTANTPQHPSELYIIDEKKSTPRQLTTSNPWLIGLKLGKQEIVRYKARDGQFEIEGMLIYPIDYKEGAKVPLITVVHGGPESHYSNGWLTAYSMPGQMAAANGYAVFYPNYRGSTGRGVTYTYSSQGDLSGKEFDDIVDGVDYLIDRGVADKERIGVTGGSYGGYASAWMSTYYSDRFAAAVMFVGISNNISKFGTSDIPTEMRLVHERGNIWDDWKKHLEISPIYYVDRSQTPILIMHGAEDPRVHPAQSMELYRHLKVRKPELPVRLIYYPGEGHGNARSGSRYDYNLRMLQWFDTYLKTGNAKAPLPGLDLPE